jgi:hypothetical protein
MSSLPVAVCTRRGETRGTPVRLAPKAATGAALLALAGCVPETAGTDERIQTWLLTALVVLLVVVLGIITAKARGKRAELRALYTQASTDVDWLLDDAVASAAVADREAHTRDVRKRSDRLHDTLSALAAAGSADLAAACVELRTRANDLAATLVARLGDPTADHRDLDVQLREKRDRTRAAKDVVGDQLR